MSSQGPNDEEEKTDEQEQQEDGSQESDGHYEEIVDSAILGVMVDGEED